MSGSSPNMTQQVIPALDCPRSVKSAVESLPISKWSGATYAGIFWTKKRTAMTLVSFCRSPYVMPNTYVPIMFRTTQHLCENSQREFSSTKSALALLCYHSFLMSSMMLGSPSSVEKNLAFFMSGINVTVSPKRNAALAVVLSMMFWPFCVAK